MNKTTCVNKNFKKSLQTLVIVALLFFVMAFECGDDKNNGSGGSDTPSSERTTSGGNLPNLSGTAWKIDWKRSGPVQAYLFCKSGRWEVISWQLLKQRDIPGSEGGGVVFSGTYEVAGDTLISKNEDGSVDKYQMSWDGSRLTLDDGSGTLVELYEQQRTECR